MASSASAPASKGPRYAPPDPTLPKPWRALIDGNTGYLYFWNPETKVTQYERPVAAVPSSPPQRPGYSRPEERARSSGPSEVTIIPPSLYSSRVLGMLLPTRHEVGKMVGCLGNTRVCDCHCSLSFGVSVTFGSCGEPLAVRPFL